MTFHLICLSGSRSVSVHMNRILAKRFPTVLSNGARPIYEQGGGQSARVLLPQNDKENETRQRKLQEARAKYQLEQKTFSLDKKQQEFVNIVNVPPLLKTLPSEEKRSCLDEIQFAATFLRFQLYQGWECLLQWLCRWICRNTRWTVDDMINQFSSSPTSFVAKPKGCEVWQTEAVDKEEQLPQQRTQADYWFAWERLNGVTRNLIKQVEIIPEPFAPFVKKIEQDHPYLGDKPLAGHAKEGNLYVVDLTDVAVDDEKTKQMPIAPVALFVIWNKKLMPVAINLKSRNTNGQVYMPALVGTAKDIRPWVNARVWFGMADASYHESITHLGFTHLFMDGVSVCMHRNLSDRHPMFKLLHPHFRYMHAINSNAVHDLLNPGGYVDKDMYFDRVHMLKLIATHNRNWRYNVDACIQTNLATRGVMDLPGYFFKEDALLIHAAIRKFVDEYTTHYYKNDENVQLDKEMQAFRDELTRKRTITLGGGCGMNGIPEFTSVQNVVDVITNFIYICSVEHSATNFPQYEQYGFPPNFPALLHGLPEQGMSNLDIVMPTQNEMLATIKIMKVLILALTNSLGNYEEVYLYAMDDAGRTFVKKFQENLVKIEEHINKRNADIVQRNNADQVKEYPYEWLVPKKVLNSISN